MPKSAVVDPYVPDSGSTIYAVTRYELDLQYKVASNRLTGQARLHAVLREATVKLSIDLSDRFLVSKVAIGGRRVKRFSHKGNRLVIRFESEQPTGTAAVIDISYVGSPRPYRGPWGEVGWEELTAGVLVAGQPNGASTWFPCNDHPSVKSSFRISITTDTPFHVVSNGVLTEQRTKASQTTWVYDEHHPMAAYLATVHIGQYVTQRLESDAFPIRAAFPRGQRPAVERVFAEQGEMAKYFTEVFGPYPFDEYTVVITEDELEIPLEAQGISVFGLDFLTDGDRQRLISHELAHQWFGNSLSVGQWSDIWLNEGFACYAEWLWSERSGGPSADALARSARIKLAGLPQDLRVVDPGPKDMFDDRIYKRGALTLHALRSRLGDTSFFDLLNEWTDRYRHATVTTELFLDLSARYARRPLTTLWEQWLYETALPGPIRSFRPNRRG